MTGKDTHTADATPQGSAPRDATPQGSATEAQSPVRLEDLEVGQVVATRRFEIGRDTLVRYAGASGDFNPIHYDDEFARSVGLDGVIAHGMLTMGTAIEAVAAWIGDPSAIRAYSTRFTKPVPVPGGGRASLDVTATIGAIDPETGTVRVDLVAETGGAKVLGRARATVAVPSRSGGA